MRTIFTLLYLICALYTLVLLARIILDLVLSTARDWSPSGFLLVIANFVYRVTDPPLRFLNKYIPPLRLGAIQFDMGFLVLFFGIQILQSIFARLA
ncbi:YggT family protein [Changpingibacter yushuensis]|uniref:YggT family protein n=1 Tax=Changpingibacter yushuensis TaxID=2758440 RepID=UPI0015F719CB|nr:YggT family protein [Changpingibacter yushuensis]